MTLHPEQAAYVAPNGRHAFQNAGDFPIGGLLVTTVRMAWFFAAIGGSAAGSEPRAPSSAELAAFPRHVAEFGQWVASPEENAAIGL
nr:hypothetical protein [uncultured Rhodopila sp.]